MGSKHRVLLNCEQRKKNSQIVWSRNIRKCELCVVCVQFHRLPNKWLEIKKNKKKNRHQKWEEEKEIRKTATKSITAWSDLNNKQFETDIFETQYQNWRVAWCICVLYTSISYYNLHGPRWSAYLSIVRGKHKNFTLILSHTADIIPVSRAGVSEKRKYVCFVNATVTARE